jgi:hypothetical protein
MHDRDRLAEYLDGALAPEVHETVARHLRACPSCLQSLERSRRAHALLRARPLERPPSDLTAQIMADIQRRPAPSRARGGQPRPRRMMILATAAMVILALAGVGITLGRRVPSVAVVDLRDYVHAVDNGYERTGNLALVTPVAGSRPISLGELRRAVPFTLLAADTIAGELTLRQARWIGGRSEQIAQLIYSDGTTAITIVEVPEGVPVELGKTDEEAHDIHGFGAGAGYIETRHFHVSRIFSDGTKLLVFHPPAEHHALLEALVRDLRLTPR